MTPASRIKDNFSRGAASYDSAANFQDAVARELAAIAANAIPGNASGRLAILELGCGTGLLTKRLLEIFPNATIAATDISPAMLEIARAKLSNERLSLIEHDFNSPFTEYPGSFDMAVSSLALQWADTLPETLDRISAKLKPEASLVFSVPLKGSLCELMEIFSSENVRFPGIPLPSYELLYESLNTLFQETHVNLKQFRYGPFPALECLRRLRSLGTVNHGLPLSTTELRKALRAANGRFIDISYKVALCHCSRKRQS